ncbi:MAG: efflux RND transporter periplasmic adaptor subunit [Reyranella sp.]|nr:efflux RND transporter periplasmic adaptor subunit [Reyranella sp.]
MNRMRQIGLALAALATVGGSGYWAGHRDIALSANSWLSSVAAVPAATRAAPSGPVIYYRDPDGRPSYSAVPWKTEDGREFLPVRASEEVSFDREPPTAAANSPASGETRRVLYYRNPMGLPDTSRTPKKDSMGMDYIPVYEGEDEDGATVKVSLGKLQRTGVRSERVERRAITKPVRTPGTVQPDERRVSVVATRSDAFIEKVADVTTGDRVAKGQELIRLYSPEIASAGAQFITDLTIGSRGLVGGGRQRLENLGVAAELIAEIERTRKVPFSMIWTAPRTGVVLERAVVDGMKANPGDVLFRIADLSTIWVLADVPEYALGGVKLGDLVAIRVRSLPGRTFEGRVALIYPQVSKETRTTKVRVEIANPDGVLLPNMYADVEITTGGTSAVVAVPDSALIDTGTRQVVLLDKGNGRFEPRDVKVGTRGSGYVEIRNGVAEGDKVVVAANFLIDAESNLKAALNGMARQEAQP